MAASGAPDIRNLSRGELAEWLSDAGETAFRHNQLRQWLFNRGAQSFHEMTNIGKHFRARLGDAFSIGALRTLRHQESDDGVHKFLFGLPDGAAIESVVIPDGKRVTLCVSSQAGCAFACKFCRTGQEGLTRNLEPWEILEQLLEVRRVLGRDVITNIVLMGMGEPLHNYENVLRALEHLTPEDGVGFGRRRVTLSTVGLVPEIRRLGEDLPVNLAVSLVAPTDALRSELMPINKRYPLAELMAALRAYPVPYGRRLTLEYCLIAGVNDSPQMARALITLVHGLRCKVNLIPFNPVPGAPYRPPADAAVFHFREILHRAHVSSFVREPRGRDISAACGQLAGESRATGTPDLWENQEQGAAL